MESQDIVVLIKMGFVTDWTLMDDFGIFALKPVSTGFIKPIEFDGLNSR